MFPINTTMKAFNALNLSCKSLFKLTRCSTDRIAGYRRTTEERVGIPNKPKKPLTPYFRFMMEVRSSFIAKHPQLGPNEIIQGIAKLWNETDQKKKLQLQEEFKKEQAAYLQKRADFEMNLTDEQKSLIKANKQEMIAKRERIEKRKELRELDRPKKAQSPFFVFMIEQLRNLPRLKDEKFYDFQKRISAMWMALSDKDKEKYSVESIRQQKLYDEDLLEWEKKMIKEGREDLVRAQTLCEPKPKKPRKPSKKSIA